MGKHHEKSWIQAQVIEKKIIKLDKTIVTAGWGKMEECKQDLLSAMAYLEKREQAAADVLMYRFRAQRFTNVF